MRTALLAGLCLLLALGCGVAPPATAKFLALGDSYTIGESVGAGDRWPERMSATLRGQGADLGAPWVIARTGWTTDELSAGIDAASPAGPFELVTLMIGVNDQFRGRPVERFVGGVGPLLDRSVALAGGRASHVVAISIPDWGATPFAAGSDRAAIGAQIDAFNAAYAKACAARGVRFVDVTPISRQATTRPAELIAGDGLHPSPTMHAAWAAAIAPAARAAAVAR